MTFELIVFEYAAAVIGLTPWEASRDAALLARGHGEAAGRYGMSRVIAGIDVYNLEAEAMGAAVTPASGSAVPTLGTPPLQSIGDVASLAPIDVSKGRLGMTLDAVGMIERALPGVLVQVPVAGPFSVAAGLLGLETLLCELVSDPITARDALLTLADRLAPWHRELASQGLASVVFDSGVAPPMLPPDTFSECVAPALDASLHQLGHPAELVIGGDTLALLQAMLELPVPGLLASRETDQEAFVRACGARPDVRVRVNMDGRVLAGTDVAAVDREFERAALIASSRPSCVVGSGVVPYDAESRMIEHLANTAMRPTP